MKNSLLFLVLSTIVISTFCQTSGFDDEYYLEDDKYEKVDLSRVIDTFHTEKYVYYFYDTTDWKAKEILIPVLLSASPFLIIKYFNNPYKFLFVEAPFFIAGIIYTKIYTRKNRYVRVKK